MARQTTLSLFGNFLLCGIYLLFVTGSNAASVSLNRHTRYEEVKPGEFNCTGIPDGYFVHPSSCSIFYACVGGKAYKSECLPGLLYHQSTTYCENQRLVNCSRVTSPTTTADTTTKITTTTSTTTQRMTTRMPTTRMTTRTHRVTTVAPSGHVDCSGQPVGTLLRNPADCTKYFECDGSSTVPFVCAGNTVFNERIHGCDYRQNVPECK